MKKNIARIKNIVSLPQINNNLYNLIKMKKVVLSLAFVAAVLVSCNKKGTEGEATDSTVAATDSTVAATDSTVAATDSVAGAATDSVAGATEEATKKATEEVKK
jgi:hypothetical protein